MLRWLIATAVLSAAAALPAAAQDAGMTWQDAVAELAAEKTRAETCVSILKRHAPDDGTVSMGQLGYSEAKADVDAVIGTLVVALAEDGDPDPLGEIERRMAEGIAKREAFCATVLTHVPESEGGTKSLIGDVLGEAVGGLIEAVKDIYLDVREADRLTRATIQTQLEATRWRDFGQIDS